MDDFDDFDDGFEDGDSMEDSSYEDFCSEDSLDNDIGIQDEPAGDDMCEDNITVEDAVFIGGTMMGWGYEEGLDESERRRIEREMDKDK